MLDKWKGCRIEAEGELLFKAGVLPPVLGLVRRGLEKNPDAKSTQSGGLF
jgi:hypothetical protein